MVTMEHIRQLGYSTRCDGKTFCARGVREWCAANGIDYIELVQTGITVDRMRSTDSYGDQLADIAEGEGHGRQ